MANGLNRNYEPTMCHLHPYRCRRCGKDFLANGSDPFDCPHSRVGLCAACYKQPKAPTNCCANFGFLAEEFDGVQYFKCSICDSRWSVPTPNFGVPETLMEAHT